MGAVSVSALMTQARLYADERPGGSAAFIDDTELESLVRASVKRLRVELTLERGPELFVSTSAFSTSTGVAGYALPGDHLETLRVQIADSGGSLYDVPQHELGEASRLANTSATAPYFYRLDGTSLAFAPTPTGAYAVRHLYTQTIDSSASTFDLRLEAWEDWVARDAAVRMLQIQGRPHTWHREERDAIGALLQRQAQDRIVEDAIRIRDVSPDARKVRW